MTNPHNKGKSAVLDWLNAHVGYQGDDCLTWPFSRRHGYAGGTLGGKSFFPCRIMCERENGPPPTPKHEAAHSCGRGHLGCINPKHLRWKTRSENQRDRQKHGTQANAYWGRVGKLTPDQPPRCAWPTIDALLKAGVIERGKDDVRRDAMGVYNIPSFYVPLPIHWQWCDWCSEQPEIAAEIRSADGQARD